MEAFEFTRKLIPFDVFFGVYDTDCVVLDLFPESGDRDGMVKGQVFQDPTGKLQEAMETDTIIHNRVPMEGLGVVLEGNIVPIHDALGNVCGAVSTAFIPMDGRTSLAQELAIQSVYRRIISINLTSTVCNTIYMDESLPKQELADRWYEDFRESILMGVHPDELEECTRFTEPEYIRETCRAQNLIVMECRMFDFKAKSYVWMELAFRQVEDFRFRDHEVYIYMERNIHQRKIKELKALEENQLLIRQLKQANHKLFQQSVRDGFTGLYNRSGMMHYAELRLKDARQKGRWFFLLVADVNRLKYINDNFGHGAGDDAIAYTARFLVKAAGEGALVGRMGGDEFLVVNFFEEGSSRPEQIAAELQACMDSYNLNSGKPYDIRMSYGWEFKSAEEISGMEDLMHSADRKMYEMKRNR